MKDPNSVRGILTRRMVVKQAGLAAGVALALPVRKALSVEPAPLDVKDPAAVAQGYVVNAAEVDVKRFPEFVAGSNCENCLQLQGSAGNNYRPCSLFPGKLVSVAGWCKGWTPEM
jgi:High potential iron-sulfur protein